MEPTKKVDPPQARNNTKIFNKLVLEGKEVFVFQGYKYVLKNSTTLIPVCGIIAKKKDFTPFDPVSKKYPNLNMNRFLAYAEALEYLGSQGKPVGKKGKTAPPKADPQVKELEAKIKAYEKIIADQRKAEEKAAKKSKESEDQEDSEDEDVDES